MKLEDLSRYDIPLVGFDGKVVTPKEQIKLSVLTKGKEVEVNFIVVNAFSPYTAILGRPWFHAMGVVLSTLHQKIKFPTEDGVAIVRANQKMARQYLVAAINHKIKQKEQIDCETLQQLIELNRSTVVDSVEELLQVPVLPYTDKWFQVGKSLPDEDRVGILLALVQNMDVFAWSLYDVLRVDLNFIMHKLNIDPKIVPKK